MGTDLDILVIGNYLLLKENQNENLKENYEGGMSLISERYSIAPQLKDYDQLATDWRPYTMFRQSSNFISKSVTTDEHGQRYTLPKNGKRVNQANVVGKYDIVVGASTAFGVGSSCDSKKHSLEVIQLWEAHCYKFNRKSIQF